VVTLITNFTYQLVTSGSGGYSAILLPTEKSSIWLFCCHLLDKDAYM